MRYLRGSREGVVVICRLRSLGRSGRRLGVVSRLEVRMQLFGPGMLAQVRHSHCQSSQNRAHGNLTRVYIAGRKLADTSTFYNLSLHYTVRFPNGSSTVQVELVVWVSLQVLHQRTVLMIIFYVSCVLRQSSLELLTCPTIVRLFAIQRNIG